MKFVTDSPKSGKKVKNSVVLESSQAINGQGDSPKGAVPPLSHAQNQQLVEGVLEFVSGTLNDIAQIPCTKDMLAMSTLVSECSHNLISVCDVDTFEVLYLNKKARTMHDITDWSQLSEFKCYSMFYNRDERCESCPYKELIGHGGPMRREIYLPRFDRYYSVTEDMVTYEGRRLCLQISVDTTHLQQQRSTLDQQLAQQKALFECVKTLTETADLQNAIDNLLKIVCEYYDANRAYIFELRANDTLLDNTYEWCREGVSSEIFNLQNVPAEAAADWFVKFREAGAFSINRLSTEHDKSSPDYRILQAQGIESLMATPLLEGNEFRGFLGVDDPRKNVGRFELLTSIAHFVLNDIQKRRMGDEIERRSFEDVLTGLANRNMYMHALEGMEAEGLSSLGVAYVDVNGLKPANDMYGHAFGDSLLIQLAGMITSIFHSHVYRVGGDEFVALAPDMSKDEFVFKVDQLRRLVSDSKQVTASVGAAWDDGRPNIQQLIKQADQVMYANKQRYYESTGIKEYNYHSGLTKNLLEDIEDGRYHVYLQPKIDLNTEKLFGAEALIRRIEEDGRVVFPDSFLPLLETSGIIRHIDFFVLETVCKLMKTLQEKGTPLQSVSVNFSRVTLQEYNITPEILAICNSHGIDPGCITIEVTETASPFKNSDLVELITQMKQAGFCISLDDYGSEYSNITTLSSVGFDEIKLDRSIVSELPSNDKARTIVAHTIQMIKDLKVFKLVAEGIETQFELDMLKQYGCDYGQGYYFSRPVPIESFLENYFPQQ